jgi:hypothetical protein
MTDKDPFNFDLRVSTDKKKRRSGRRGMSGAFETSQRVCEHEGCEEPGQYRAPKSPDNLEDFKWFCREHVREYNLKWNFFEGTTEAEMEAQLDRDRVWDRPTTKPFKKSVEEKAWARLGIEDPHQVLGQNATRNPGRAGAHGPQAAADRAPCDGYPRRQGQLDEGRNSQVLQGLDQGSSSGHERRRPLRRGTPAGGRLGLGPDQGQPELRPD